MQYSPLGLLVRNAKQVNKEINYFFYIKLFLGPEARSIRTRRSIGINFGEVLVL